MSHTITTTHTVCTKLNSTALLAAHHLCRLKLHNELQQPTAFSKAASLLSTFSQTHKIYNIGIIANFVILYICIFLLYVLATYDVSKYEIRY